MPPPGVYATGLRELRRDLRKVAPELLPLLRNELKKAVDNPIVPRAQAKIAADAKKRTGAAEGSIRAISRGNTIYIAAGGAKVPYYGWLDFGGTLQASGGRRNTQVRPILRAGRYLYPAIAESRQAIADAAGKASDTVLDRFAARG